MKDKNLKERCFLVLLGNKADLDDQRKISTQEGEIFASQYGMFFLEISNVSRKNLELVQKVMRIRATHLLKKRYSSNSNFQSEKSGLGQYDSDYSRKETTTPSAIEFQSKTSDKEPPQYHYQKEVKPAQRVVDPIPNYQNFLESREKLTTLELSDSSRRTRREQAQNNQLELHNDKLNISSPIKVQQGVSYSGMDSFNIRGTPLESERRSLPATNRHLGSSGMKNESSFRISPPGLSEMNESRKDTHSESHFDAENRRDSSPMMARGPDMKYEPAGLQRNPSGAQLIQEQRLRKSYIDPNPDIGDFSKNLEQEKAPALPPREDDQSSDFLKQFNYNFNRQLSVPQNTTNELFGIKHSLEGVKIPDHRVFSNSSMRNQSFSKQIGEEHIYPNLTMSRQNSRPTLEARQSAKSEHSGQKLDRALPLQQKSQHSYLEENNISFSHFGYNPNFQSNSGGGVVQSQRNNEEINHIHQNILDFGNQPSASSQKTLQRGGGSGGGYNELTTMSPGRILERYQQEHPSNSLQNREEKEDLGYQEPKIWNQIETLKPISARHGAPSPLSQDKEEFQFISAGSSEKGSGRKQYHPFDDDAYENPTFKDSRLSDLDQDIQRLEESLNNIDLNLVRGRSFTEERSFSQVGQHERVSQERVLREKVTQERHYQRSEDKQPKRVDLMQDSLNKRTNRFHDELELSQNQSQYRNTYEMDYHDQENRNPFQNKSSEKSLVRGDENKQSHQSLKKQRSLSYVGTKSPKSDNRLPVPAKYQPVIFVHLEDSSGNIDILPIYAEDTAMAVAERYLKHRNIPTQKNVLKRLADIIEERINTASYEYEAFISKYEEQVLRDKNAYDRQHLEKNLKEAKPFNFETDRRNIARSHDEQLIGKLYVELENRRVIVLNLRQKDSLADTAMAFTNVHSLSKDYYQLIFSHLHQLKQMWQKIPQHTEDNYPVLNLVLKDFKTPGREHSAKDLHSVSNSRANLDEHAVSRSPNVRKGSNILFKLNLDTGNGRVAKIVVREGDNLKKIAHNFTITHKLGPGSYERIHQLLINASKNNASGGANSKQLNSIVYIG